MKKKKPQASLEAAYFSLNKYPYLLPDNIHQWYHVKRTVHYQAIPLDTLHHSCMYYSDHRVLLTCAICTRNNPLLVHELVSLCALMKWYMVFVKE